MNIEEVTKQTSDFIQQFEDRKIKDDLYDELIVLRQALIHAVSEDNKTVMFLMAQDVFKDARKKLAKETK